MTNRDTWILLRASAPEELSRKHIAHLVGRLLDVGLGEAQDSRDADFEDPDVDDILDHLNITSPLAMATDPRIPKCGDTVTRKG